MLSKTFQDSTSNYSTTYLSIGYMEKIAIKEKTIEELQ
jgi:hypothetical protein